MADTTWLQQLENKFFLDTGALIEKIVADGCQAVEDAYWAFNDNGEMSLMSRAIWSENIELITALLDSDYLDVVTREKGNVLRGDKDPFWFRGIDSFPDAFRLFWDLGLIDPEDASISNGRTGFHLAAIENRRHDFELLLRKSSLEVAMRLDGLYRNPLHYALFHQFKVFARWLVKLLGKDLQKYNTKDSTNRDLWDYAANDEGVLLRILANVEADKDADVSQGQD